MTDLPDNIPEKLSQSAFRSRFRLSPRDKRYIADKGWDTIRRHAEGFVRQRPAPDKVPNDGKQTPMRGHPVFITQHACCCRQCLYKWHHIPPYAKLAAGQQTYIVNLLLA